LSVRKPEAKTERELSEEEDADDQSKTSEDLQGQKNSFALLPNENNIESAIVPPVRNLKGKLMKKAGVLVVFVIVFIFALFTKILNKLPAHLYNQTNVTTSIIIH
jgi:hypothetical protein